MAHPTGKRISISPARRFIIELMHASQSVPLVTIERRANLAPLLLAREQIASQGHELPCWSALFVKALCLVAKQQPFLRQTYLPWPWQTLYEHPHSLANVAIERIVDGEAGVYFQLIDQPENTELQSINDSLQHAMSVPINQHKPFRRQLWLSSLPWPLNRLMWSYLLYFSGKQRARFLGTVGVSGIANLGSSQLHLRSPLTATLHYGVIAADQTIDLRLTFDHRVTDGGVIARTLEAIEESLNTQVAAEMVAQFSALSKSTAA